MRSGTAHRSPGFLRAEFQLQLRPPLFTLRSVIIESVKNGVSDVPARRATTQACNTEPGIAVANAGHHHIVHQHLRIISITSCMNRRAIIHHKPCASTSVDVSGLHDVFHYSSSSSVSSSHSQHPLPRSGLSLRKRFSRKCPHTRRNPLVSTTVMAEL